MSAMTKNNSLEESRLTGVAVNHLLSKTEIEARYSLGEIVGCGGAFKEIVRQVEQVALTDKAILIVGETGTGKYLAAETIHQLSDRASLPFLKINCTAFPAHLLELKLFGHENGDDGLVPREAGMFELAAGGSVFLSEIDAMPPAVQEKLLCLLKNGTFVRVGGSTPLKADVRVIAATRTDLKKIMEKGGVREDLYQRLISLIIKIPPLRERKEDIPALVCDFIHRYRTEAGENVTMVPQSVIQTLQAYSWPGNVRELQNIVLRSLISCEGDSLELEGFLRKR